MIKNYKIADHKCYHTMKCTVETFTAAGGKFWEGFAKPVVIIAAGITVGMPIAWMIGTVLGYVWRLA